MQFQFAQEKEVIFLFLESYPFTPVDLSGAHFFLLFYVIILTDLKRIKKEKRESSLNQWKNEWVQLLKNHLFNFFFIVIGWLGLFQPNQGSW